MMAATCASCGSTIRSWPNNAYFCPGCKTLSCHFCRRREDEPCPACGNVNSGWDMSPVSLIFLGVLVLAFGLISSMMMTGVLDELTLENMPVTPMDKASPDGLLKISGRIDENLSVAIDGHEEKNKDWKWIFDSRQVALVNEAGTSRVILNLSGATIMPGPHAKHPAPEHVKGTVYRGNDTVYAVGTMYVANGTSCMHVMALSPQDHAFDTYSYKTFMLNFTLIAIIAATLFMVYLKAFEMYGRRNMARLGGRKSAVPPWDYRPARNVVETPNKITDPSRRSNLLEGAAAVGLIALYCVVYTRYPIEADETLRTGVLMILGILAGMPAMFLVLGLLLSRGPGYYIPVSVSIGDDGFQARYRDGSAKGFRWSDIRVMLSTTELEKPGKRSEAQGVVMVLNMKRTVAIPGLSRKNADAVSEAFRKGHSGAEHDFLKALVTDAPRNELLDKLADKMIEDFKPDRTRAPQAPGEDADKE